MTPSPTYECSPKPGTVATSRWTTTQRSPLSSLSPSAHRKQWISHLPSDRTASGSSPLRAPRTWYSNSSCSRHKVLKTNSLKLYSTKWRHQTSNKRLNSTSSKLLLVNWDSRQPLWLTISVSCPSCLRSLHLRKSLLLWPYRIFRFRLNSKWMKAFKFPSASLINSVLISWCSKGKSKWTR